MHSIRLIGPAVLFLAWLVLVQVLPGWPGGALAAADIVIYLVALTRTPPGRLDEGHPPWGCYLNMRQTAVRAELDRILAELPQRPRNDEDLLRPSCQTLDETLLHPLCR